MRFLTTTNKKIIFAGGILLFSLITAISFFVFNRIAPSYSISLEPTPTPVLDDRAIPTTPPDLVMPETPSELTTLTDVKRFGVLILGYGGAGHQGGFLSDVMLLAYIDTVKKQWALIHIPRDIWVTLPTGDSSLSTKINAALALGTKSGNYPIKDMGKDAVIRGSYLSRQAVKQVTGLPANFVIGIDFNGFAGAINALRGIDVTVGKTLDDEWYPIKGRELELCGKTPEEVTALSNTLSGFALEKEFPCRYEALHFPAGATHMDGDTVLKYVRSRHSTSDFDRGVRQQEVMVAIMKKLISLNALDSIPTFFTTLSRAVKTDLTEINIKEIAPVLAQLPTYRQTTIGLSTANTLQSTTTKSGASALIPKAGENNWQDTQGYIQQQLAK